SCDGNSDLCPTDPPKRGDDERQRRQHEERPAEPLQGPRNDQRPLRPGEPREQRAEREHGHAGNEEPPPPEQVGKPAAQEQRSAEQDRVGGNDPLQALLGEVQVVLDRRQRDEHDRNVEDDYELRRYRDGEYQPALLVRIAVGSLYPTSAILDLVSHRFLLGCCVRRGDERAASEGTASLRALRSAVRGNAAPAPRGPARARGGSRRAPPRFVRDGAAGRRESSADTDS